MLRDRRRMPVVAGKEVPVDNSSAYPVLPAQVVNWAVESAAVVLEVEARVFAASPLAASRRRKSPRGRGRQAASEASPRLMEARKVVVAEEAAVAKEELLSRH